MPPVGITFVMQSTITIKGYQEEARCLPAAPTDMY
jgi:hypothetical protein